jgi:CheY-like chemotaxis protein
LLHRAEHPSVIVLEYRIRELSSSDFLQHLKQNIALQHIPVIVYSSEMSQALQTKLLASGAAKCFSKTPDMREMKEYLQLLRVVFAHSTFA